MPRKNLKSRGNANLSAESFLRSINIRLDADTPERIAHFHPTAKSVNLLNALLGRADQKAFFVVAPYGSGKSLTSTYLLNLVENRRDSRDVLKALEARLTKVSPDMSRFASQRGRRKSERGLVLALEGYCPSVAHGLLESSIESAIRLGLKVVVKQLRVLRKAPNLNLIDVLLALRDIASEQKLDRIAIVWDEFGRHIESLILEGKPNELSDLQGIAEFIARTRRIPITLGLLLHQGLLNYGSNLPQSVRSEWAKIEGRFDAIQYVDDSKEIYTLLGDVIEANRPSGASPEKAVVVRVASECRKQGLFTEFKDRELKKLLTSSFPIEPATLYLLPRVSARVAQNERTLFSFISSAELNGRIGPDHLYDYFSGNMRADTAVGGTYRQWLETESALSKISDDPSELKALKAACLLGLGTTGHRSRAGLDLLTLAVHGFDRRSDARKSIDRLINRKLLLYRRHSNDVAIWHGTDVDLRGKLEDKKRELRSQFDLLRFLSKEVKPPSWRPTEYNDEYFIRRFLRGEFKRLADYATDSPSLFDQGEITAGTDGKVVYLIPEKPGDLKRGLELVKRRSDSNRLVFAVPQESPGLHDAALEVWTLAHMEQDADLVGSDPLVVTELHQMAEDARGHLHQMVGKLIQPSLEGPRWFYEGKEFKASSPRDLRVQLSEIMRRVFPKTPKLNNELIVRHRVTPQLVNSRKKFNLALLNRCGEADLGLEGDTPDVSMFRCILRNTRLYRQGKGDRWGFASPRDLKDHGLREVWERIQRFLIAPSDLGKPLRSLLDELREPPYGIRGGLLPIFLAAGFKAFPNAVSLTKDGIYIEDIKPSDLEDICKSPDPYRLVVLDLDPDATSYLRKVHKLFSPVSSYDVPDDDLIRLCFDAIEGWKAQLPPAALTSTELSPGAMKLQKALLAPPDPVGMLFREIPEMCGQPINKDRALLKSLKGYCTELLDVSKVYSERAKAAVLKALSAERAGSGVDLRKTAGKWACCFPDSFVQNLKDGVAKGLLSRMLMEYESEELLIGSLASLLVGKGVTRWDDTTVSRFDQEVQSVILRIEEAALKGENLVASKSEAAKRLATVVKNRIMDQFGHLVNLLGEEDARKGVQEVIGEGERQIHGSRKRSS